MKNGDPERATGTWLVALRAEFIRIASRRVDDADVEDVAQEAMRVIVEKGVERDTPSVEGAAPLAWCFQVLRNTIGNYYQRRRTRRRWTEPDTGVAGEVAAIESFDSHRTLALVERALEEMRRSDPQCARYLSRLADGERVRDIAGDESLDVPVFSRRLYRCRRKLRDLLTAKGVVV